MTDPEPHDFEVLYRNTAKVPWDTKAPKETVVEWQQSGLVRGDVLDIGCGLGDNAIYLAQQGHRVTALDVAPTALITAERRAIDAHVDVRFAVSDATELAGYTEAFDTVVDSGMYHCLDDADKARYAAAVHRATRPGARLLLSAFSDANARDREWPRPQVSEATLRATLGDAGWEITTLESRTVSLEDLEDDEAVFWYVVAERGSVR
ncbi:class I SAM-dependent methyltransferase [[Mycobacterium] burgundiense]|uniref:Class I SAM-dependent methyltransferase n=1 Tax=[Mycobacterium] burgundiense TaxID=3064286 RepID=A0ABM9LU66_9MYCO|nr:class I SAM-dependent methyltransferase [Mycolicibacterium sp. MU0053]CAJ1504769.1 class I SAM-dependent methyltransferase [Mycolicibacterium sp. MU0053]